MSHALFWIIAAVMLWPSISAPVALITGMAIALSFGNPALDRTRAMTKKLLSLSIIALGAGMNLHEVARAGAKGALVTAASIALTMLVGAVIGRALKTPRDTSLLVTVGTAICGGSAIAAVSQAIRAKPQETSVALATVFVLNAIALFVFPAVGHAFGMTEPQFGLWSALAIHDTSSVVGATLQYGPRALEIGTTVKLTRALWIVPLAFAVSARRARDAEQRARPAPPWFILGFVLMAALFTFWPAARPAGQFIEFIGRRGLVLTLFFIGAGLTRKTLQDVGFKPFLQGLILWVLVGVASLTSILLLGAGAA